MREIKTIEKIFIKCPARHNKLKEAYICNDCKWFSAGNRYFTHCGWIPKKQRKVNG